MPTIYYVLWTPNENSDFTFYENHPQFFPDYDSAQAYIDDNAFIDDEDGALCCGEWSGPYIVPTHDRLAEVGGRITGRTMEEHLEGVPPTDDGDGWEAV